MMNSNSGFLLRLRAVILYIASFFVVYILYIITQFFLVVKTHGKDTFQRKSLPDWFEQIRGKFTFPLLYM